MALMVLYMSVFTEGGGLSDIILETRAKVDIEKGEEITIHYAGGLKPRMTRKKLLKDGWFFDCQCIRWVPTYISLAVSNFLSPYTVHFYTVRFIGTVNLIAT